MKVHQLKFEVNMFLISQFLLCVLYLDIAKRSILPILQFLNCHFANMNLQKENVKGAIHSSFSFLPHVN